LHAVIYSTHKSTTGFLIEGTKWGWHCYAVFRRVCRIAKSYCSLHYIFSFFRLSAWKKLGS